MTSKDVKTVMSIKALFDKPVCVLSEGLMNALSMGITLD